MAKLDQNESPLELPAALRAELLAELGRLEWNRYPQPTQYEEARRRFAEALDLDPDTLALTAGADQAIQGAHFVAGGPGRRALVFEPTYPMLAHAGLMAGTTVERIELGLGYDLRPEHLEREAQLILIASPNNPTGGCLSRTLLEVALARPALIFIDEAYYDFSRATAAPLLASNPNLMLARSCSKSLLAGMRLGYTISHPEIAQRLDQLLTAPYHLSHVQLLLARRYGELLPYVEASAALIIAERERLAERLREVGLAPEPSAANFLLVHHDHAAELAERLAQRGVRVRYAPRLVGLDRSLRITVGAPEHNDLLVDELHRLLEHLEG